MKQKYQSFINKLLPFFPKFEEKKNVKSIKQFLSYILCLSIKGFTFVYVIQKKKNKQLRVRPLTIVMKIPNSGFISIISPSVKMKVFFFSFLAVNTTATCCAATDKTGSSMRLNSSKQPQVPDCASPL